MCERQGTQHLGTSTSCAGDSRASISPRQVAERALMAIRAVHSGSNSCASFANFDRASLSWRTAQGSLLGGSTLSSEDFPKAGMTRSGSLSPLPTLERRTGVKGRLLWPTPTRSDATANRRHGYMLKGHPGTTLTDAVVLFLGLPERNGREHLSSPAIPNPDFVEGMMGLSRGWTDVDSWPSATP